MTQHPQCEALWQRAQAVLAGGPATLSKHPSRFPQGLAPTFLARGEGPFVWDVDGHKYIDTIAALGPILLGHNDPHITEAIWAQSERLTSASLSTALEVETAEMLCDILPGVDLVRWMKNGSDATNAAIRLARAVTHKRHVICSGYSGANYDWYAITTDKNAGVLTTIAPYSHQIPWGDPAAFVAARADAGDDLAAIIVEVPPFPWNGLTTGTAEETHVIQQYQQAARSHGALFILDEVITMLRYGLGGAQTYYGIEADLVTGGKALANGLPLAVLAGKRELMQQFDTGNPFCSYTFGGEATALAACKATLTVLQETSALVHLQRQGVALGDGLQALFREYALPAQVWGNYARLSVRWQSVDDKASENALKTLWLAENIQQGILHGLGVMFPMTAYNDHVVAAILQAAETVCKIIRKALDSTNFLEYIPCNTIDNVFNVR